MRFGFFLHIAVVVLVSGTCLAPSSSSQAAVGESSPRPLDLGTPEMSAAIVQVLSELEDSDNEPSRLLEAWELHRDELRQDREAAVDHLAADRRSESKQDRLAAAFLLGRLWGPSAVRMLQALAQDDPAPDVRLEALESLVWGGGFIETARVLRELRELGPAALRPLIEAFAAPTHSTRLVGRPLAEIGGWGLVALLSHVALEHPDPARRQHALRFLLEASQFEHLLRTLGREATEEGDTEIGRFARSALAACRPRESPPWNLESPRGMNR